jgi:two-component sensor histidine kinase
MNPNRTARSGPVIATVTLAAAILTAAVFPSVVFSDYVGQYRVLVLNSYHKGYKWTDDMGRGIEHVFEENPVPYEIFMDYMDTKRLFNEEYMEILKGLFREKYEDILFDVIISTDDNAFNFLLANRDNIFAGAPVVFCGVNNMDEKLLEGRTGYTGVSEDPDFKATINTILRIHPNTTEIAVVIDQTTTGFRIHETLIDVAAGYPQVKWRFLEDFTMEELVENVNNLHDDAVVLYTLFLRDKEERFYEYDQSTSLIAEASPVPVYGTWDFSLGYGIIGGKLTSGFYEGVDAARMALRVLKGTPPETIPIVRESPNRYMFDYRIMKRFGIDPGMVPEESVMINRPFSVYEQFRGQILMVGALFFLLSSLVLILYGNIVHKRKTQGELARSAEQVRSSLEEKEVLLKEVHHRVKNNLQVISGLLNLQAHHITDQLGKEIYKESQNRIISMALIHEELYQARDLARVDFGAYIENHVENLFGSYSVDKGRITLDLKVDHTEMVVDTAIPCGLIVNELISNCLKHAFPDEMSGRVRVAFHELSDKEYELEVADNGVGLPSVMDITQTASLGMQLICLIVDQLKGKMEVSREGGTGFRIIFKEYLEAGTDIL